jgi:hypothetical protein
MSGVIQRPGKLGFPRAAEASAEAQALNCSLLIIPDTHYHLSNFNKQE